MDYILNQITKKLVEYIEKKKKVMVKTGLTENTIHNFFESINYKQVLAVKNEVLYAPK